MTLMNTDIMGLSLVISVNQCHQWFNKTSALVFSQSLFDLKRINKTSKTTH
jgi:hypothetical protein